ASCRAAVWSRGLAAMVASAARFFKLHASSIPQRSKAQRRQRQTRRGDALATARRNGAHLLVCRLPQFPVAFLIFATANERLAAAGHRCTSASASPPKKTKPALMRNEWPVRSRRATPGRAYIECARPYAKPVIARGPCRARRGAAAARRSG